MQCAGINVIVFADYDNMIANNTYVLYGIYLRNKWVYDRSYNTPGEISIK